MKTTKKRSVNPIPTTSRITRSKSISQNKTGNSNPSEENSSSNNLIQTQTQTLSIPDQTTNIQPQNPITMNTTDSVRVPFPNFKSDDIESWFRRLEYWFEFSKVQSEHARFTLIASQIDDSTVSNLEEILNPHDETPYTIVKAKIISIFQATTSSKINKLLSGCQLGDLKPSQLLAEMKRIGGNVGDDILRNLWSKRLPLHLQPVIAAATHSNLNELAVIADAVIDAVGSNINHISSIGNNTQIPVTTNTHTKEMEELRASINQLTETISKMQKDESNTRSRSRSRSQSRSRPKTNDKDDNGTFKLRDDRVCFYHRRFGNKAKLCTKPCTFEQPTSSNEAKN